MWETITTFLWLLGRQLASLFGVFFIFGGILSLLQHKTQLVYRTRTGWWGVLSTAWIGTPFHELSHAVVALLFGHTIHKLALFQPNERTGELGYVDHTYSRWNPWKRMGNFFIGAAPLLIGSFILVGLLYLLVPNAGHIFGLLKTQGTLPDARALVHAFVLLFSIENMRAWYFWIFLYVSFAIANHMAPSKKDRSGMWSGLAWIIGCLTLVNAIAFFLTGSLILLERFAGPIIHIYTAILLYALLLSLLHLVIIYSISSLIGLMRK